MAGFNTAVTGIKATTTALDVTGNNIANASTAGFKATRAEFADIYSTQVVGAGSSNVAGSGVLVSDLAQDFSGGTTEFTNSNLDLAVNGSGFFQLDDGQGGVTYTRAGAFELDKDGYIVSKNGKNLQGFGLDAQGGQTIIGDLQVKEKESPPHWTENIGLSVNLRPDEKLDEKADYYSKTNTNSYAYTTTIRTYDSLGNDHTVKLNYVEQKPQREQFVFELSVADRFVLPAKTDGSAADLTVDGTGWALLVKPNGTDWPAPIPAAATGVKALSATATPAPTTLRDDINKIDPSIDTETMVVYESGGKQYLYFERHSDYNGMGEVGVKNQGAVAADPLLVADNKDLDGNQPLISSAEQVRLRFNSGVTAADAFDINDTLKADTVINIGGVDIKLESTLSRDAAGDFIVRNYESAIKAKNPNIESVKYDNATDELIITWKPEAGDIADSEFSVTAGDNATVSQANAIFEMNKVTTVDFGVTFNQSNKRDGDNGYDGVYRLYAYLNDEQLLDIGKGLDPGEKANGTGTEPGPILLRFSPGVGQLEFVNGERVNNLESVPKLRIMGADLANPKDELREGDLDELVGIQLDISGSTRWESPTIVKAREQDGYAKGDLISVSFDERGYMVASYSNGQKKEIGIVALATFASQSGLQPAGDTEWVPTLDSGSANLNPPGTGLNGSIRSGALEQSNVDLSAELVKLIEYQRNYQANSKTLETLNTVTQSILQI